MSPWLIAVVVVVLIAAVLIVRRTMRGAIVEHLPLMPGESVLLREDGLKVFHKIREARGGTSLTYRVTVALTDRRILVATGGPEGKHKLVLKLIIDYRTPAPPVSDAGYGAYRKKFQLANGYPTYYISPADARVVETNGEAALHITVPFPEHGSLYTEPEVIIYTNRPEKYGEVFPSSA